jgi:transcriptional regulator with XRE-family HTH domain
MGRDNLADQINVGSRLKVARQQANIDVETAAQHLGITQETLTSLEDSTCQLSASLLYRAHKLYEQPLHWFFMPPNASDST